jgi:hypothetical protein
VRTGGDVFAKRANFLFEEPESFGSMTSSLWITTSSRRLASVVFDLISVMADSVKPKD